MVGFFVGSFLVLGLGSATAVVGAAIGSVVAGLLAGAVVLAVVAAVIEVSLAGRRAAVVATVREVDSLPWSICTAVNELSLCGAWRDGTVDPQRRVKDLLWATVERARTVDARRDLVRRARSHASLDQIAAEETSKIEREESALREAANNLKAIVKAAREIDRMRESRAREQAANRVKAAEERDLRSKLLGGSSALDAAEIEEQADAASGLAAESEAIAALLAQTDRLLNG
jgi:hypothetical protein